MFPYVWPVFLPCSAPFSGTGRDLLTLITPLDLYHLCDLLTADSTAWLLAAGAGYAEPGLPKLFRL